MASHRILNRQAEVIVPSGLCALGIMTKAPEAGKVKTRLTPPLTAQEAAELNRCFLRDIARTITTATGEVNAAGVAVYTPIGAEAVYDEILTPAFYLIPQRGEGFGERLIFAVEDLLACGFESVCLINSDSPIVSPASFAEAVRELSTPGERVVLGPSDDGGYYLIGVKKLQRRLFEEIDWSTAHVLSQTMERAAEIRLPVQQLPAGYDVDETVTLHRLCDDLLGNVVGAKEAAPNTRKFLNNIIAREGRARVWPE